MPVLQTAKPSNGRQIQCPALRRNKANKLVKVGFICLILLRGACSRYGETASQRYSGEEYIPPKRQHPRQ